ncbi:acyltransferase [Aquimarina celericrescens]|uniref:Acyltransferase n=1 Tax=Aquimarina celericrescens TaxID=1964542 RepID=A0ABW5AUP4_9FLAO|nr:acyltransferase [Aquimarina celericrescens]
MDNQSNQLRKHLKFTLKNHLRAVYQRFRGGNFGNKVFIDKNVSILRFPKNIYFGDYSVIKEGANICACNKNSTISIGNRTTVGFYTFIYASEQIEIGNDCLIAPFVYIVDSDHSIAKDKLINMQPNTTSKITIEDDVWIATGAKILKGVTVGKGAVIAAGSVVKDDVPPYTIVGGIPAKTISKRE